MSKWIPYTNESYLYIQNKKVLIKTNQNNIYVAQREVWHGEELWYTFSSYNRKTKLMQSREKIVFWKYIE